MRTITRFTAATLTAAALVAGGIAPQADAAPKVQWRNCSKGIYITTNGTCPFARNVVARWNQVGGMDMEYMPFSVYSPVTRKQYRTACAVTHDGVALVCATGAGMKVGVVWIP